jgi:hypothetical protein
MFSATNASRESIRVAYRIPAVCRKFIWFGTYSPGTGVELKKIVPDKRIYPYISVGITPGTRISDAHVKPTPQKNKRRYAALRGFLHAMMLSTAARPSFRPGIEKNDPGRTKAAQSP